jgi:hypothetical protein
MVQMLAARKHHIESWCCTQIFTPSLTEALEDDFACQRVDEDGLAYLALQTYLGFPLQGEVVTSHGLPLHLA